MLEMAAELGHMPFSDDQLKTIILSAAFGTIRRFTMGIMEEHHTATNPATAMDEERRIEQRMHKLQRQLEQLDDQLTQVRKCGRRPCASCRPHPSGECHA